MDEPIKPIPEDVARGICEKIRERNKKSKISFSKMMCWGCSVAARMNEKNRCMYDDAGAFRGCFLINKEFNSWQP